VSGNLWSFWLIPDTVFCPLGGVLELAVEVTIIFHAANNILSKVYDNPESITMHLKNI